MKKINDKKQDLLLDALSCIDEDILAKSLALRDGRRPIANEDTPFPEGTVSTTDLIRAPKPPRRNPWRVISVVAAACLLFCVIPLSVWMVAMYSGGLKAESADKAPLSGMQTEASSSGIVYGPEQEGNVPSDSLSDDEVMTPQFNGDIEDENAPELDDSPSDEKLPEAADPECDETEGCGQPLTTYDKDDVAEAPEESAEDVTVSMNADGNVTESLMEETTLVGNCPECEAPEEVPIDYTCDLSVFPLDTDRMGYGTVAEVRDGKLLIVPGSEEARTEFGVVVWLVCDYAEAYSVGQVVTYTFRDVKAPKQDGEPLNIIASLVYME